MRIERWNPLDEIAICEELLDEWGLARVSSAVGATDVALGLRTDRARARRRARRGADTPRGAGGGAGGSPAGGAGRGRAGGAGRGRAGGAGRGRAGGADHHERRGPGLGPSIAAGAGGALAGASRLARGAQGGRQDDRRQGPLGRRSRLGTRRPPRLDALCGDVDRRGSGARHVRDTHVAAPPGRLEDRVRTSPEPVGTYRPAGAEDGEDELLRAAADAGLSLLRCSCRSGTIERRLGCSSF